MEKLKISKGFTPVPAGRTDMTMVRLPFPSTLGCAAGDIPFIRPKLLVREGDDICTGTPLFSDKRDPSIRYVSPGTGTVQRILFGERRRLKEVIIVPDEKEEFIRFDPISAPDLADMPPQDLAAHLKQGGLWQGLRQFPSKDTADPAVPPAMIIVSLNGNDIASPHPALVLENKLKAFNMGMAALTRFSHRVVVTARESSMTALDRMTPWIREKITHLTPDTYPAWNPGAVLYQLKETQAENGSWCISLDHLIMMGCFLITGQYPVEKLVTLTRDHERRPHMLTRQGAPLNALTGAFSPDSLMTTGRFNGRILNPGTHLGFFENTVNIIGPGKGEEMFGFVRPGLDKPSASSTFLSALFKTAAPMDCTLHGEERACINCSYCEAICPNDLMPSFIMKALHADEIEEALGMGLLDCCQCGLCSYACPSKIELAQILSGGMTTLHKDKT